MSKLFMFIIAQFAIVYLNPYGLFSQDRFINYFAYQQHLTFLFSLLLFP